MRYIKTYENMRPVNKVEDAAIEKLFNHFQKLFHKLGYNSSYYEDDRIIEFYKYEGSGTYKYMFCFEASTILNAVLTYKKSLAHQDDIQSFIPKYLETIMRLIKDYNFEIVPYMYKTTDLVYNIDKIISRITLEDFQLKFKDYLISKDADKYNV